MAERKEDGGGGGRPLGQLLVEPSKISHVSSDTSFVEMTPDDMESLGVEEFDYVVVRGRQQMRMIAGAVRCEELEPGRIRMNDTLTTNLKVFVGSPVSVKKLAVIASKGTAAKNEVKLSRVVVSAFEEDVKDVVGDLMGTVLTPYFGDRKVRRVLAGRPVWKNTVFKVTALGRDIWFKVVKVETVGGWSKKPAKGSVPAVPIEYGMVDRDTQVECTEKTIKKDKAMAHLKRIGYQDIGGLGDQLRTIREMVELPLRHPKLFSTIGVKPPKGVLMHGPPGCGKTLIARAIAAETNAFFSVINGPEIIGGARGESEENLRRIFAQANEKAPAIIFIDEIDAIAPDRDKQQDETMRRVVTTLLTEMDGIKSKNHVIVIGATNRPNALDGALRRAGRFDSEIIIGVPSQKGRLEILEIMTRKQKLAKDVDLVAVSKATHGYVGADLATMCMKAAVSCIRRRSPEVDMDAEKLDAAFLDSLEITMDDVLGAIGQVQPSALKDVAVEVPDVSFEDIGGLEEVKQELIEMVEFPVKYPELFDELGKRPPSGALFYGPPGCGKTLLAKAMANECEANFISIKGPQLLSKWVGEAEGNVRDIFDKARQSAPCILFFDELDALAPERGMTSGDSGIGDTVVNQLLTEMDGMGERQNVFIVGATNRVERLDPAIRRAGRLDQHIYIPLPDEDARAGIIAAQLRRTKVAADVDLEAIARDTEHFSGADLAALCQMAVKNSVRDRLEKARAQAQAAADAADAADADAAIAPDGARGEKEAKAGGDKAAAEAEGAAGPTEATEGGGGGGGGSWEVASWCFAAARKASAPSVSAAERARYLAQKADIEKQFGGSDSQLTTGFDMSKITGRYQLKGGEGSDVAGDEPAADAE